MMMRQRFIYLFSIGLVVFSVGFFIRSSIGVRAQSSSDDFFRYNDPTFHPRMVNSDSWNICPFDSASTSWNYDQVGCGQLLCSGNEFTESLRYACNSNNIYYWGGKPEEQWVLENNGTTRRRGTIACSSALAYKNHPEWAPECMRGFVNALRLKNCSTLQEGGNTEGREKIDFYAPSTGVGTDDPSTWTKIDLHQLVPEDFFEDGDTENLRLRIVVSDVPSENSCPSVDVYLSFKVATKVIEGKQHGVYEPPKPFKLNAKKEGRLYIARIPRSIFPSFRDNQSGSDRNVYVLSRFLRGAKRQTVNGLMIDSVRTKAWIDPDRPTNEYTFNQNRVGRLTNNCGEYLSQTSENYFMEPLAFNGAATVFAGPNDPYQGDGKLSLVDSVGDAPDVFPEDMPDDTKDKLFSKVDPDTYYVSRAWWGQIPFIDDVNKTKLFWRDNKSVIVWNPANGKSVRVHPIDYGPKRAQKADIDLSVGAMKALGGEATSCPLSGTFSKGLRIGFGPAGEYGPCTK